MTLPNLLSTIRIAMAPGLLYLAWVGEPVLFFWGVVIAFATDFADGYAARRLDQVSERGAQLDGWGDLALYLTLAVAAWWLWPERLAPEATAIAIIVVSYVLTAALGLLRYGRLECFHTWGGRISGAVLAASALLLIAGGPTWPMRIAAAIVVLADLEEIAMQVLLPEWRHDVPSLWHAWNHRAAA